MAGHLFLTAAKISSRDDPVEEDGGFWQMQFSISPVLFLEGDQALRELIGFKNP
jgi:hypothetical protein